MRRDSRAGRQGGQLVKLLFILLALSTTLLACGGGEETTRSSKEKPLVTHTPRPTYTLYPTYTPYPTYTAIVSSQTPKPTETTRPSITPEQMSTPVPTSTPIPTNTPAPTPIPTPQGIPANAVQAQLLEVVDGDTIKVLVNGQGESVRYIGIDTPERGQPGYQAATEANRALLGAGLIYLAKDQSERDQYGRLLRYVYASDGTFIEAEMVAQGWAQPVEYPPDTSYADEFRRLAHEAAEAGKGFWSGSSDYDGAMSYGLVAKTANIRKGPGTQFAVNSAAVAGTPLTIFGRNPAGDWLQIRTPDRIGGWMAAFLVDVNVPISSIPVPDDIPVVPTNTPAPIQPSPTSPPPVKAPPPAPTGNVVISYIFYDGVVYRVESDEYAEITNVGAAPVNLSGWHINAGDPGQDFFFPDFVIQPGQSCRIYTNEYHPETCGFSFGSGRAIWNNKGDCGHLYDASGAEVSQRCY